MQEMQELINNLEAQRNAWMEKAGECLEDARQDEGNLAKIRANIYEIVLAVCGAAQKAAPEDALAFIQNKLETIPLAWQAAREAARQHGDQGREAIEDIKLETLAEIRRIFPEKTGAAL